MWVWEPDRNSVLIGNCVGRNNVRPFLWLFVLARDAGIQTLILTAVGVFIKKKKKMTPVDYTTVVGSLALIL